MAPLNGIPGPLVEDPSIADFLGRLAAIPRLELEWIDLLSQLEYVGCRKIVKSVGFEAVSLEILRHVSEEASHAYLLNYAERSKYVARFIEHIDWDVVAARYRAVDRH